jgi:branched-chain amino acid transport system ATP-binding protein
MNAVSTIQFDPASKPEAAAPFLSVQDIHSYYGESYIVQGVSFDIAHSEILALLGRNGAGKTSTLRTIGSMVSRSTSSRRSRPPARASSSSRKTGASSRV